jgi:2,4-dienoyl-CoA reductase-like NADH-dependent reductase (Old Yellow Enzyme family)
MTPKREPSPAQTKKAEKSAPTTRAASMEEFETDEVMAAFRQAARNRGWMGREALFKEVSVVLGFQRLGSRVEESLKNHLRAAIRRGIIDADGPVFVRIGAASMADYTLEELREALCSVMKKGAAYEREDVIEGVARHLGFSRLKETVRAPIKSAINSAIRQGLLGYEGNEIWRVE